MHPDMVRTGDLDESYLHYNCSVYGVLYAPTAFWEIISVVSEALPKRKSFKSQNSIGKGFFL